jgi:hypothetical protein
MRSFALSMLCVTPTLFVSACGDNQQPADDDVVADGDVVMESDQSDPISGDKRELLASLDIFSPSCEAATAAYEVVARYSDSPASLTNLRCRITFDDGAVSDTCFGEHTFASGGAHKFVLEIVDLDTGASARVETTRIVELPVTVDLALDVPECGLELEFDAAVSSATEVHVTMSPAEKVVEPHVFGRTGKFQVLEPGTYTILVSAEDERTVGPICSGTASRTVELRACHDHEPGCGH